MEATTNRSVRPPALEEIVPDALEHLVKLGYSASTLSTYRGVWSALIRFSRSKEGTDSFSEELCDCFLASHDVPVGEIEGELRSRKRQFRAAVRVLVEFAEHGSFRLRRRATDRTVRLQSFREVLQDYLTFSKDHLGHGHRTLRLRKHDLADFLHFLESRGIRSPAAISGPVVTEFVSCRGSLASATLKNRAAALRSFLRHLRMRELIVEDLSPHVPTIRRYRYERIPSVWTQAEVTALLGTVDRCSPQGKRDYAILLLACRLGMRVGDIRELRLENLLWSQNRIEIAQAKTGASLNLPMSEEVGRALIDYLQHGRPASQHREVFLRLMAPFEAFGTNNNLHHIVSLYRRRAGVEIPALSRRGMHSLRHTVATRLLEKQVPIETIAGILGHQTTETTRVYTKVDINSLRTAALDPKEVCDA